MAWFGLGLCLASSGRAVDSPAGVQPGAEFFRDGALPGLELQVPPAAWRSLQEHPRDFVRGTVRVGAGEPVAVALRVKGSIGSFRPVEDRPSLTLDFAREDASGRFHGLRRLQLLNSVEDPGLLHERLGSEVFRAAGVPAPRTGWARLRLNQRALGLYVLKEGCAPEFLAAHFTRTDGALYDDDAGHDVDQPLHRCGRSGAGQADRVPALAAALTDPDPAERWRRMGESLDLGRFPVFAAVEVALGHRDGYGLARNNFRIYHDPGSDRLVFLPDGMDQLLGNPDLPWRPHFGGKVAQAMLDTPAGREAYEAGFRRVLTESLDPVVWKRPH